MEVNFTARFIHTQGDFFMLKLIGGFVSGSGIFISSKYTACGDCCRHRDRPCIRLVARMK